jgi:acetyl-CoA carboxylase biotin carboxyl carrier protein
MSLDLAKLGALLDLLIEKDIAEFEHEEAGVKLRIARSMRGGAAPGIAATSPLAHSLTAPATLGALARSAEASSEAPESRDYVDVTSPFVGSFYRAPSPDVPPFVEVGSVVRAGQALCIIEAMKLMNEIESECAGTVIEIFAQNGKSVEFGQKLFRIKKA